MPQQIRDWDGTMSSVRRHSRHGMRSQVMGHRVCGTAPGLSIA